MSGQVFEYFFEPEELEPFYSELPKLPVTRMPRPPSEIREMATPPAFSSGRKVVSAAAVSRPAVQDEPQKVEEKAVSDPLSNDAGSEIRSEATVQASSRQRAVDPPTAAVAERQAADEPRTRIRQLLSVHALGQYVFCARSAILAVERGDEQDIDVPLPRLSYLPNFDRERIEELLRKKLGQLAFSVAYSVSMFCLMVAGVLSQNKTMFYPAMFVFMACLMWFLSLSATILQLVARHRAAIKAEAREPDPQVKGIQAVNWWSMLKAGFEPVNYQRPFQHPELPLEGCPWRILERDSQRIPVIRSGADKLGNRKGELYPKHRIRLVAYALLLEAMGHNVPYGLVFPRDSARGLALQITDELREGTACELQKFAAKLHGSQRQHVEPSPPENRKRCENCRHGQPKPIRPSEIEIARKSGKRVVVLLNGKDKTFHCDCGDRFGTAPPHGTSIRLGLRACLE